ACGIDAPGVALGELDVGGQRDALPTLQALSGKQVRPALGVLFQGGLFLRKSRRGIEDGTNEQEDGTAGSWHGEFSWGMECLSVNSFGGRPNHATRTDGSGKPSWLVSSLNLEFAGRK